MIEDIRAGLQVRCRHDSRAPRNIKTTGKYSPVGRVSIARPRTRPASTARFLEEAADHSNSRLVNAAAVARHRNKLSDMASKLVTARTRSPATTHDDTKAAPPDSPRR